MPAIDTHDASAFTIVSRRTLLLRLSLAGVASALVVAAAATARDTQRIAAPLLPTRTAGVVVLDLSLSIADEDYVTVRRTLRRLVDERGSAGLVVFSDVPYELFPPRTPVAELRSLLRLLVPPRLGTPVNPWSERFRAGTKISTALELAGEMLERDGVEGGTVLLVSDLETAPTDVPALTRTIEGLRQRSIELRVVPLSASSDARLLFAGMMVVDTALLPRTERGDQRALSLDPGSRIPFGLLVLGGSFFLVLALQMQFATVLALPRASGRGERA